jgi:4-hydroxybenzoate polyprenyltransferase
VLARIRTYGSLVAFAHTIFALPFAASAVVLSFAVPHAPLGLGRLLGMLACLLCARTSAMAFNRWADRDIDARNPRTRMRHVPSGKVRAGEALTLGLWPTILAPLVLAVLLGYSYAKRFTWAAHAWLGIALALAPGGAWLAMGARPGLGIICLMVAVVTWLTGLDTLYSLQDEDFDRQAGLRSIPARFGTQKAIVVSEVSHVVTVVALAACGIALRRGSAYALAVAVTAALLSYEHWLVRRRGLAAIGKAFFDVNAWISCGFFVLVLCDALLRR